MKADLPQRRRASAASVCGSSCVWWCLLCLSTLLVACDDAASNLPASADEPGFSHDNPTIVSLTPSITQMLIDMGKNERIVGLSTEDHQLKDVPRCGSFNDPIIAQVLELKPDIVLTETPSGGPGEVPQRLRSLAADGVFDLAVLPHMESIADIQRALTDEQAGLGRIVGDPDAAMAAWRQMAIRMELVEDAVESSPSPRVMMLIDPVTLGTIGTGVTHDELLKRANAVNAAESYNTGYLTLTRSQVQQSARPDVILIFESGGPPLKDNDPRLRALAGLGVPAVENERIVLIDHPHAMLPSTGLAGVLAEMAAAIHPDRAAAIERAYDMADGIIEQAGRRDSAGGLP